jgi:hypothetical protein
MASRYESAGDGSKAEDCYLLAAELAPEEPDPKAFAGLADLYASMGRLDKLEALLEREEVYLFRGKGEAYRESHQEKIFEFHRTLGKIYGHLEKWEDDGKPTSAIFQLEHAREVAKRLDSQDPEAREPRFTADMAELLSKAYEAQGQTEKSLRLRIEVAEEYRETGDEKAVSRLLEPVQRQSVPDDLEVRFRALQPR